jgi:phage repressor protein C with HTH and peptisase S24 domain
LVAKVSQNNAVLTRYNPEYLYAITVCGDSMATTLHDGDIVVINVADKQWSMVRSTRSTTRVRQP